VRKSLVSAPGVGGPSELDKWLDLEKVAAVELTSENPEFPIEHALGKAATTGWRAESTGPQTIRLLFDSPQVISRIQLHFVDRVTERTQEFALFALLTRPEGDDFREVVRQQWNFSPHGTTEEFEDYRVMLEGVTALELRIDPDRSHDPKLSHNVASLQRLRLA
jgi:hypothetical protein